MIICILALSFLLRVYKLDSKPVWYDEAVSIAHAEKPLDFYFTSPRVNYKPVYFLLLKSWVSVFGEEAFPLRGFSLIWGLLSIGLIYKLGKELFDARAGLFSAFLLSISVFHIYHCQQIRQFSLMVFLTLLSCLYFIKFIKKSRIYYLFIVTLANIILINTHPYGLYVCLFEIIFALLFLPKGARKSWIYSQVFLSMFILFWLALPNKEHIKELLFWIQRPNFYSLMETIDTFSWGGVRYGLDDFKIRSALLGPVKLLSYVNLALLLFGLLVKTKYDNKRIFFLFLWLVIPISISFLLSRISGYSIYAIKHLIIVLPAFYIIIGRGLCHLKRSLKIIALAIILFLNILPLKVMYNNYFCTDWQKSAEYVKGLAKENEAVIVSTLHEVVPFIYYFKEKRPSLQDMDIYGKIGDNGYENVFFVDKNILIAGITQHGFGGGKDASYDFKRNVIDNPNLKHKNIWAIFSRWTRPKDKGAFLSYLDSNYIRIDSKEFQGTDVFYFKQTGIRE